MNFVLFVEGDTEKKTLADFFKRWLDPKLERRVGLKVVKFGGWAELVKESPKKAKLYLKEKNIIAVFALLDLYGPTLYPDAERAVSERYKWAKSHLERKVDDTRFRQHFAVHETEAWLFSNPALFPKAVKDALPAGVRKPEEINFDQPPSKLLGRLYKEKTGRRYKKVAHGKDLFDRLDPETAYGKCPYLKRLLDDMLKIAREAGL
ncbi:MAG: DUF4276 family protein [Deltaproteobacteria bacterium]|jgi:hypothetical protein|nr:DUF4276 family protein [Deltaproteobacteria bacterium]MBT7715384.1 DUF4276 family protein [Deltaproteobacteria bacterium]